MLFLHKQADFTPTIAVFTGARPKDHETDYEMVDPDSAEAMQKVDNNVKRVFHALDIDASALQGVLDILKDWAQTTAHDRAQKDVYAMMGKEGIKARGEAGILANFRYYNNYVDLVLALYGEYLSTNTKESGVAGSILGSEKVKLLLHEVAEKITAFAEQMVDKSQWDMLASFRYAPLHPTVKTWMDWTQTYKGLDTAELVACLYDITMGFDNSKITLNQPLGWTKPPMEGGAVTKDNMRINVSTVEEDLDWTAKGRWADVPIWAGPSYTAQLMFFVARKAGCTADEIRAFAYALFAFWNQRYPLTATPVHRMYGVMTAAKDFGVPPEACDPKTMYNQAMQFLTPL